MSFNASWDDIIELSGLVRQPISATHYNDLVINMQARYNNNNNYNVAIKDNILLPPIGRVAIIEGWANYFDPWNDSLYVLTPYYNPDMWDNDGILKSEYNPVGQLLADWTGFDLATKAKFIEKMNYVEPSKSTKRGKIKSDEMIFLKESIKYLKYKKMTVNEGSGSIPLLDAGLTQYTKHIRVNNYGDESNGGTLYSINGGDYTIYDTVYRTGGELLDIAKQLSVGSWLVGEFTSFGFYLSLNANPNNVDLQATISEGDITLSSDDIGTELSVYWAYECTNDVDSLGLFNDPPKTWMLAYTLAEDILTTPLITPTRDDIDSAISSWGGVHVYYARYPDRQRWDLQYLNYRKFD